MSLVRNMPDILLSGFNQTFLDFAKQLFKYKLNNGSNEFDIIVMDESGGDIFNDINCKYIICPPSIKLHGKVKCNSVITCGMDNKCTLSFSSIDYDKALLSINRRIDLKIKSIHQCEKPVDYYEVLTVYENLVIQALSILTV